MRRILAAIAALGLAATAASAQIVLTPDGEPAPPAAAVGPDPAPEPAAPAPGSVPLPPVRPDGDAAAGVETPPAPDAAPGVAAPVPSFDRSEERRVGKEC